MCADRVFSEQEKDVLAHEFSSDFVVKMKERMIASFYKYGPVNVNAGDRMVDEVGSLKVRLEKYLETGNTEFLVDVANFAMIEFMFPRHARAHFRATDAGESPGIVGFSVNEVKAFHEDHPE